MDELAAVGSPNLAKTKDGSNPLEQYGYGRFRFTGDDDALFERHLLFDHVITPATAGEREQYEAAARSARDILSQRWMRTQSTYDSQNPKRVYYLSMESALSSARSALSDQLEQTRIAQFLLRRQGERLREHARAKRVRLIGDLPFFVSPDSSDVWVNPELFLLDEQHRPRFVAGVPPDYFSSLGQLRGNPVYDWDAARRTGYRWCIDRLRALLTHVDMVRLDHFRAFAAAWHVRAAAATAQIGDWVPGPGADFFAAAEKEIGSLPFIAEDLGLITPDVGALRDRFRLPGMRVLQFAFDGHSDNPHRPDNFMPNTVVYTGTHDNPTTRGWFDALPAQQKQELGGYLGRQLDGGDAASALIELAWSSGAALAIAPLQDFLNLGNDARMNLPGRADGNWRWRFTEDMLTPETLSRLLELTQRSARMSSQSRGVTERHVT